jgi:hypothetical protein
MKIRHALVSLVLVAAPLAACAAPSTEGEGDERIAEATGTVSEALNLSLPFQSFTDSAPSITFPLSVIITSAAQYQAIVGHPPPIPVDWGNEWVIFYSAGQRPTGGYVASIEGVGLSFFGPTLLVRTNIQAPGPSCIVPQVVTHPQAFAKIRVPTPRPRFVRFFHDSSVRECQNAPACGGITGARCPGFGTCVDNPNDTCDPSTTGADCPGICVCRQFVLCIQGYRFDSSPFVCSCVPQ